MPKVLIIFLIFFISCDFNSTSNATEHKPSKTVVYQSLIDNSGATISDRFSCPKGFKRVEDISGFARFLRNSPLKPSGTPVRHYDGSIKQNNVHEAVLDYDVGKRDLQQCADAVMRLRAEFLYAEGQYDDIHFNFTNGFNATYSKWRQGQRISVIGNKVNWYNGAEYNADYKTFRKYLDMVYSYAGTLSLEQELKPKRLMEMEIGNVLIHGGSPGHAVIVVDMCESASGEKLYMLAQSYMPAQSIHVLKNQAEPDISPWYRLKNTEQVITPEWRFENDDLKGF